MTTDGFEIDKAQFVGLFLMSIGYGIYLVTFVECVIILARLSKGRKNRNRYILGAAMTVIFIFISLEIGLAFQQLYAAFVRSRESEETPDTELVDIPSYIHILNVRLARYHRVSDILIALLVCRYSNC